ncbi:MAG: hypothetical protein R2762_28045 [Bryobacteraceae bacterium]
MASRKQGIAFLFVLAWLAGLAITGYGLQSRGLLRLPLWEPASFQRLLWFTAAWVVVSLLFFVRGRRCFPIVLLVAHALWMWAVNGPAPLAAQLWMGAAALAIGLRITALQRRRPPMVAGAIAWITGMAVIQSAMSVTAHFPVNTAALWVAVLGAAIFFLRRGLVEWARGIRIPRHVTASRHFGRALLAWPLSIVYAQVLGPEVGYDALAVHLMVPATVARVAAWPFDVARLTYSLMPLGVDWSYSVAYLLGGEHSVRLLNFLFLGAILAVLHEVARRWLRPGLACLTVAVFASNPIVPLETGHLFIENGLAAYLVGAAWLIDRMRSSGGALIPACWMLAAALGSKLGSLPYAVPLLILAFLLAWKQTQPNLRAIAASLTMVFGGLPYLYSYWVSGNPVFPFENQYFLSPLYPPEKFVNLAFVEKLTPWSLFPMTFDSPKYLESGAGGAMGFALIAFAPLALAAWAFIPRRARGALLLTAGAAAVVLSSQPYIRYIYPSIALFTVPLAASVMATRRWAGRWVTAGLAGSLVICTVAQVYFRPTSTWHHSRLLLPARHSAVERFEREIAPSRQVSRDLSTRAPGEKILYLDMMHTPDYAGVFETYSWHTTPFAIALHKCKTAEEVEALVRAAGIRHVIGPVAPTPPMTPAVAAFLQQRLRPLWAVGGAASYELIQAAASTIELAPPGLGGSSLRHRIAITLPAPYRFAVEARCPSGGAARLRIQWRNADGAIDGADERILACGGAPRTLELTAHAPVSAAAAELSAEPAGRGPIEIGNVSFRNLPDPSR